ncbi:MAG: fatty acid desaturase [Polyangiales bacterium]
MESIENTQQTADATPRGPRSGKELIDATRPFAEENRTRSLLHVAETFGALALFLTLAMAPALSWTTLPLKLLGSVLAGLTLVRGFILFHDVMHGAMLRNSKVGRSLFGLYGCWLMTPPLTWKQTHNYHHAHTAQIVGSHVGSFMLLTTDMYKRATPAQQRMYRLSRHPLTLLFGYFTIFVYGFLISSFLRNPKKNWSSLATLLGHAAAVALIATLGSWQAVLFGYFIPLYLSLALGGYLFYAQHNFPDMHIEPRETWTYTGAALESSSYMELGPVMAWFTGNIGYHHVHHLNPSIPFYRLPEAMAAIPELQNPHKVTLSPSSIAACFKLKLWDSQAGQMVGFPG